MRYSSQSVITYYYVPSCALPRACTFLTIVAFLSSFSSKIPCSSLLDVFCCLPHPRSLDKLYKKLQLTEECIEDSDGERPKS